jgi:hypothetical protein
MEIIETWVPQKLKRFAILVPTHCAQKARLLNNIAFKCTGDSLTVQALNVKCRTFVTGEMDSSADYTVQVYQK